jgi:hypothetical protein
VRGANPLLCGCVIWVNVEFLGDVEHVHGSWRECRVWRLAPVRLDYLYPLCSLLLECRFHFECEEGQEQLAPRRSLPETLFIFLLCPLPYVTATARVSRGELWERVFLGVSNRAPWTELTTFAVKFDGMLISGDGTSYFLSTVIFHCYETNFP